MSTQTRERVRVHIRWLIRRDMPDVARIELDRTWGRWTEDRLLSELRGRNVIGMVAEDQWGEVVGFMVYALEETFLDIIKFGVRADRRRAGVGRQMVDKLVGKLSGHRRTAIETTVRERDLDAQLFFRACGFWCEGVVPANFPDSGEDGYDFAYRLPEGSP